MWLPRSISLHKYIFFFSSFACQWILELLSSLALMSKAAANIHGFMWTRASFSPGTIPRCGALSSLLALPPHSCFKRAPPESSFWSRILSSGCDFGNISDGMPQPHCMLPAPSHGWRASFPNFALYAGNQLPYNLEAQCLWLLVTAKCPWIVSHTWISQSDCKLLVSKKI